MFSFRSISNTAGLRDNNSARRPDQEHISFMGSTMPTFMSFRM